MFKKNPLLAVLGLSAFFFVAFLAVVLWTMSGSAGSKGQKKLFAKSSRIGVLEVKGVIMDSKKLLDQIDRFEDDALIRGVIVRINSPGGAVAPSQEIYDALKRLGKHKPVYASMGSVAASGGYYVACGTKKVFASPGTMTGSIGVIMQFADLSKLYQWAKVNPYNIKTGKFKDIGSPNREMGAEEKQLLQEMIDNVLSQFRKAVVEGRGLTMEKVIEVSDGRIFSGEQAKALKLIDELGGMTETVEAIAAETGISGKPTLVYATKKKAFLEKLMADFDDDDNDSESSSRAHDFVQSLVKSLLAQVLGSAEPMRASPSDTLHRMAGPLFLVPRFLE